MSGPGDVLWRFIDAAGDVAQLHRPTVDEESGDDTLASLSAVGVEPVWLTTDAARRLRDALNRLLGDDGGTVDTGGRQATLEGAYALHAGQHRQLAAAARRIADHVDEHAAALARFAADRGAVQAAPPLVGMLLDVQRRSVADLGDLLDALAGQP